MKMKFLALVFLSAFHVTQAQVLDELPKDENGKINFNGVVKVDSTIKQKELYLRARQFFADEFKDSKEVIQMDDKDAGVIIGKAWGDIVIKVLGSGIKVQMWFTIKLQSKDGRYRYELYDIYYKSYPSGTTASITTPAEETFDTANYFKNNGKPRDIPEKYKQETLLKVEAVADLIKKAMSKPVSGNASAKNDW